MSTFFFLTVYLNKTIVNFGYKHTIKNACRAMFISEGNTYIKTTHLSTPNSRMSYKLIEFYLPH